LGNLFVENIHFYQISYVDGCHLDNSDIVEIIDGSCPYTMHDLIQSLISHSTTLESSNAYQEVKELQLSLMVMLSYRYGKIPEICHI